MPAPITPKHWVRCDKSKGISAKPCTYLSVHSPAAVTHQGKVSFANQHASGGNASPAASPPLSTSSQNAPIKPARQITDTQRMGTGWLEGGMVGFVVFFLQVEIEERLGFFCYITQPKDSNNHAASSTRDTPGSK